MRCDNCGTKQQPFVWVWKDDYQPSFERWWCVRCVFEEVDDE